MSLNSKDNVKTVIKFVYIISACLCLIYATAWAAGETPRGDFEVLSEQCKGLTGDDLTSCENRGLNRISSIENAKNRGKKDEQCRSLEKDLGESIKSVSSICGKRKSGADPSAIASIQNNCATMYEDCLQPRKSDYSGAGVIANIIGANQADLKKNCTESPRSYFARQKDLNRDIRELDDKIDGKTKDMLEVEQKLTDKLEKIYENITKEEKDFNETKKKLKEGAQKMAEQMRNERKSFVKRRLENAKNKMDANAAIGKITRTAQAKLLAADERNAKSTCMRKVETLYRERMKVMASNGGVNSAGLGSNITTSKAIKAELDTEFNMCREQFHIERQNIAEDMQNQLATVEMTMDALLQEEKSIAADETALDQMEKTATQDMDNEEKEAYSSAMKRTQQFQSQITDAQNNASKQKQAMNSTIMRLRQQSGLKNSELVTLGGAPDGDSGSDKSTADLVDSIFVHKTKTASYVEQCCAEEKKTPLCETSRSISRMPSFTIPRGGSR